MRDLAKQGLANRVIYHIGSIALPGAPPNHDIANTTYISRFAAFSLLHWSLDWVRYASPAQMAELVDALASGASVLTDVEVQVLSWAPCIMALLKGRKHKKNRDMIAVFLCSWFLLP